MKLSRSGDRRSALSSAANVKTAVFSSAHRMTNLIGTRLRALRLYKVHEPKRMQNSCESACLGVEILGIFHTRDSRAANRKFSIAQLSRILTQRKFLAELALNS